MNKIVTAAFACAAALSLAACGSSEQASETATPDNVEMPADELPPVDASAAAPVTAEDAAPAADASAAAMSAADAAQSAADSAQSAAEAAKAAAAEAESKM